MDFGRKTKGWSVIFVTSYQGYILWTWFMTVDIDWMGYLVEGSVFRFLHGKCPSLTPQLSHTVLFGKKSLTMNSTHLRGGDVLLVEDGLFTGIIWNSSWEICFFPLIHSFIRLHQSGFMDLYFRCWVIIQWLLITKPFLCLTLIDLTGIIHISNHSLFSLNLPTPPRGWSVEYPSSSPNFDGLWTSCLVIAMESYVVSWTPIFPLQTTDLANLS